VKMRSAASIAVVLMTAGLIAASSGSASGSASPVTIGISLSLSGDFSADGQAYKQGYELWASDQNKKGGLLGHPIKLQILSDASSPTQVVTNYNTLIGTDKDQLVFGPFSSLLTTPASSVVNRYGYAFVEGAGGAPTVFAQGLKNVFDVSVPVATNLEAFAQYVASLPKSERPKTAAYPTVNDPFTQPQLPPAEKIMQAAGVKTVYSKTIPEEEVDYTATANAVAALKPDVVVLGSTDVPTVTAFIHAFIQQHFNPKLFIATAGPDQGAAFINAIGKGNENGIMVPNAQGRQSGDGQGVRRQVRRYCVGGQRRHRRGLLGRPGRDAGRPARRQLRQREDHRLPP